LKLQMLGLSVPIYSDEEFFWLLILDDLIVASPVDKYLGEIVDALNINDAEVKNNNLIIDQSGSKDYKVEILFGSNGMAESYEIKTESGDIIYEISQDNAIKIVLVIIPIIFIIGVVSIVIVAIKKRRNRE